MGIIEKMRATGHASMSYLQAKLQISFDEAVHLCEGLVYPEIKFVPRKRGKNGPLIGACLCKKIKKRRK